MKKISGRQALCITALTGVVALGSLSASRGKDEGGGLWAFSGGDVANTRNASKEKKISAKNVGQLAVKWEFATAGDVSATPTVEAGEDGSDAVYAVDWGGYVYRIDGSTGVAQWSRKLTDFTGNTVGSVSRTSPAIVGKTIVLGDQGDVDAGGFPQGGGQTASVMALNKKDGSLAWRTVVSDHPFSVITASPVADGNVIYVGVSSLEESAGFIPGYPSPSFRGKVVALDAKTGAILWSTNTIDDALWASDGSGNHPYSGAAVWGSTPVIDSKRGSLYVATGNNYSSPPGIGNPNNPGVAPAGDHFDSVLALDLKTGATKWAFRALPSDTWTVARWVFNAVFGVPDPDLGPDYDFGSGPNLFTAKNGTQLLGAGQKSGTYWALNPNDGSVVWRTQVGPGGTGGGIEWGSAVDGNRVYCAISNSNNRTTPLGTTAGLWSALDAATGAILWQTADPVGGHDFGAVTHANGVLFAGSAGNPPAPFVGYPGSPGGFFALNAATGQVLWSFPSSGAVNCGPSVVNGTVYWGSGYGHLSNAFGISGGNKLYAFSL